jgi:cell division protein ZipA
MSELRWVLLGLGVALIGLLYFFSRKPLFRLRTLRKPRAQASPESATEPEIPAAAAARNPAPKRLPPEKVVTLRVIQRHQNQMSSEDAVLALKRAGLTHGKYGIFHSIPVDGECDGLFSVASLTEPGSFDLTRLQGVHIPGLSFFMTLPGVGDPVERFDAMVESARDLAQSLDGILLDERGSSWSIQRERFIREEIIQYRHQHSRH